jgi:uncharacterized membrane protein YdbT with pleckstrin-like domain
MTYVEQSLGDNETIHYRAQFPTIRYALAWLALAVGVGVGSVCFFYRHEWLALLAFLCGAVSLVGVLYRPWTTEIAVTNLRLIYKRGLFRRATNDLQMRAIEEVRIRQDLWGRIFNFGNIEVRGTGVDDLDLPALNDPIAVQKAVQEAIGAHDDEAELPGARLAPRSTNGGLAKGAAA